MKYGYDYEEYRIEIRSKETCRIIYEPGIYSFFYLIKGGLSFRVEKKEFRLREEEFYLHNAGKAAEIVPTEDCIYALILFPARIVHRFYPNQNIYFLCSSLQMDPEKAGEVRRLAGTILNEAIIQKKNVKSVHLTVLFYTLLEYLLKEFQVETAENTGSLQGGDTKDRVMAYIGENYRSPLTLKDVAEEIYVSYYTLSRNFKKMFGMSFSEYLNTVRMQHVIDEFQFTDKNITQIAIDNGYESASAFHRAFQQKFQMSPREYRQKYSLREESGEGAGKEERKEKENLIRFLPVDTGRERSGSDEWSRPCLVEGDAQKAELFTHPFTQMINGGYASDFCRADVQRALSAMETELPFRYVRLFHPFSEEMELRSENQTAVLNFNKLDQILDFLLKIGLTPWIDFGEKPRHIVGNVSRASIAEQGTMRTVFHTKSEFSQMLNAFLLHIVTRYGYNETSKWVFEFWNDYFRPNRKNDREISDYFETFDIAARIVKKWLPQAKIGGAGMAMQDTKPEFLREWSRHLCPDFISYIYSPYKLPEETGGGEPYYDMSEDLFPVTLDHIRKMQKAAGLTESLYISEFCSDVSDRNYRNDSCFEAAWCMKNAALAIKKADIVGYWRGVDSFSTSYDSVSEIFGGSGLQTRNGISKPVFYTFSFLHQLNDYLIGSSSQGIVTKSLYDSYTITVHNCREPGYAYYLDTDVRRDVHRHIKTEESEKKYRFLLHHIKPGTYRCQILRLGPSRGGMLEEWESLEFESDLSRNDIQYLKQMSAPRMEIRHIRTDRDTLQTELDLEANEIAMIKLTLV